MNPAQSVINCSSCLTIISFLSKLKRHFFIFFTWALSSGSRWSSEWDFYSTCVLIQYTVFFYCDMMSKLSKLENIFLRKTKTMKHYLEEPWVDPMEVPCMITPGEFEVPVSKRCHVHYAGQEAVTSDGLIMSELWYYYLIWNTDLHEIISENIGVRYAYKCL